MRRRLNDSRKSRDKRGKIAKKENHWDIGADISKQEPTTFARNL